MKKLFAALCAITLAAAGLCSCEKKPKPLDQEIIGSWTNDYTGYRFGDNRKVSLEINFSDRGHFTADGNFATVNAEIPKENISYDGTKLEVYTKPVAELGDSKAADLLVEMEKTDFSEGTGYDGTYQITEGTIPRLLGNELNINYQRVYFEGIVEGESFRINIIDCFDYQTEDGMLYISSDLLNYLDENADCVTYKYEIANDLLSMKLQDIPEAETEIYHRKAE